MDRRLKLERSDGRIRFCNRWEALQTRDGQTKRSNSPTHKVAAVKIARRFLGSGVSANGHGD